MACAVGASLAWWLKPSTIVAQRPVVRAEQPIPARLDYALRWLRGWHDRDLLERGGVLDTSDFPLADSLRGRFDPLFPDDPDIAAQLAIQEASDGSDREAQAFRSRPFARLTAQPQHAVTQIASALARDVERRAAGQMLRLALAIAQVTGRSAPLQSLYQTTFTRPTLAREPGSEAVLIALYGYLRQEPDPSIQRTAVHAALSAQPDPAMQLAMRRTVLLRTDELLF